MWLFISTNQFYLFYLQIMSCLRKSNPEKKPSNSFAFHSVDFSAMIWVKKSTVEINRVDHSVGCLYGEEGRATAQLISRINDLRRRPVVRERVQWIHRVGGDWWWVGKSPIHSHKHAQSIHFRTPENLYQWRFYSCFFWVTNLLTWKTIIIMRDRVKALLL